MNKLNQNVTNRKLRTEVFRNSRWINNFALLNKRKALIRLIILMIITLALAFQIPKIQFNYDFDSFFPPADDDLAYYETLNQEFGEFNNFLFVVFKSPNPRDKKTLTTTKRIITHLENWKVVSDIQSPFDIGKIQVTPFGINSNKIIVAEKGVSRETILENGLDGQFFGRDEASLMFIIRHQAFDDNKTSDAFMVKLRQYLTENYQNDHIISGKIQMQFDFTKKLEKELSSLLVIVCIFVIIVLAFLFKTIKGVLIPLLALFLCVIWTMGFLALTGKSIDVLVVIIPPILLIVALSDVIHFVHKYDDLIYRNVPKEASLKTTIIFIGKATFLTSITTAVGFLSIYVIPIGPIQDFGLYTAIGVVFAFLITFLLVPSFLYFYPKPVENKLKTKASWKSQFDGLFISVLRNRKKVAWSIFIISAFLFLGIAKLRLNTSILVGFQKNEPELEEVAYFDSNYDGYKPFEIGVGLSDGSDLFDTEVLKALENIEQFVAREYAVQKIESPLNLIRTLNAGLYGASKSYYSLPLEKDRVRLRRLYNSPKLKDLRLAFQNPSGETIRLIGRSKDIGSASGRTLNLPLESFLKEIDPKILTARLTGTSFLIDKTDNYISQSLIKGLGIAIISVSLFLFLFFRNWQIVIYSLIPNILPILMLFGLMGYFEIDLNISTAIIFTVAFGVAVDDSIHLLARYYLERRKFKTTIWCLKHSISSTGKSIFMTSLVLSIGFSLFLTSGLSSPFYLGFFIVLTALIALILDLTLLPLIILGVEKKTRADLDQQS